MNLLDLMIKVGIDDQASGGLDNIVKNAKNLGSALKSAFDTAAKVGTIVAGSTATAFGAITKTAVDSYADYEQLVGGVETLFKGSADTVKKYAENAFSEAGMSANDYMETVTSFAASLIQSTGGDTKKAAELANMAIKDMADNANKMGTDISMLQNAYQGFAKGNYTMLDNLKLGFGGTAREMARLVNEYGGLSDAQKINLDDTQRLGAALQNVGFDTMIEAVHAAQVEMEIFDTTLQEAKGTITGSISAMKAAWENLLVTVTKDDGKISVAVDTFVQTAITAAENLIPRIGQAITGIMDAFGELTGIDLSGFTEKVSAAFGSVIDLAKEVMAAFQAEGITGVIDILAEKLDTLTNLNFTGFVDRIREFGNNVKSVFQSQEFKAAVDRVGQLIGAFKENVWPIIDKVAGSLKTLGITLGEFYTENGEKVAKYITKLLEPFKGTLPAIVDAVTEAIRKLLQAVDASGISDAFFHVVESITKLFEPFISGLPGIIGRAGDAIKSFLGFLGEVAAGPITSIADAIVKLFSPFVGALPGFIEDVLTAIQTLFDKAKEEGLVDTMQGLATAVIDLFSPFGETLGKVVEMAGEAFLAFVDSIDQEDIQTFKDFAGILEKIFGFLGNIVEGVANFITALAQLVVDMIKAKDDIGLQLDAIKRFFIESYSAAMKPWEGIGGKFGEIVAAIKKPFEGLTEWAFNVGKGVVEGFEKGMNSIKNFLHEKWPNLFYDLEDKAEDVTEINSPSKVYERIGSYMMQGLAAGWEKAYASVSGSMTNTMRNLEDNMHFNAISHADSWTGRDTAASINANMASVAGLANSTDKNINVNLVMDGKVMASALISPLASELRRSGQSLARAY